MLIDSFGKTVGIESLKNKRIIMYGASTRNQKAIDALGIAENVVFFIDSNEEKNGQVIGNYQIRSLTAIKNYSECIILSVLVFHFREIMKVLEENEINNCLFYYPEFFDIKKVFQSNSRVLQKEKQYRYIHIFSNDKFVIPFYQMLEEKFPIQEHLLIVAYRIKDDFAGILPFLMEKCKKYHNVLILDDVHGSINNAITDKNRLIPKKLDCNQGFYYDIMKKIYKNAYKIILHSAFWGKETKKLVYDLTQCYASKMVWGCFGGDAYFDKDSFEVSEIIKKVGICSVTAGTYKAVKENYGIEGKIDSNAYYVYIPKSMIKKPPAHDSTHILLGHAAFEYVNHIEGLRLLQRYADEDIKIYCPLSYGVDDYRKYIIQMGKNLFGDKFIPILNYIKQEQYFCFLQAIDVAVFPAKRLAAESTILLLKAAGIKIYADIDVMSYMQEILVDINNIKDIQYETLEEFVAFPQKELYDANKLNNDIVIEWETFFENNYKDE
ncbi:MAG: TDP-N-acetylfucosamine:lipid II N-acetylfucosaminyltransferase [Lachnospira sp.]|nr:TDP-N-acetylfucosamine:lipid II N-acetylfucosaminyltransferase [Lachnospira sp.]